MVDRPSSPTAPFATVQVLISRLGLEDPRWRTQSEVELVSQGAAVVPALIAALQNHGNPMVRFHAAQALGRLGAAEALAPLAASLADAENNGAVANAAEKILVSAFGERALPMLLELAQRGPAEVRPRAVRALGKIASQTPPGKVAADVVRFAVRDPDAAVRTQGVTALALVGGATVAPDLISSLADPSEWVRQAAAEALVEMKRGEGRPLLQQIAKSDEDMYTRRWAEELLDRLDELERLGELIG